MAVAYLLVKWLHVLAAAALIGWFALVPLLRASAQRSGDGSAVRFVVRFLRATERTFVQPAVLLVVGSGLLMTMGPIAEVDLFAPEGGWALAGLVLTVLLALLVAVFVGGTARAMLPRVERGETVGPAMERLWRRVRFATVSGAAILVVVTALMVFRPVA